MISGTINIDNSQTNPYIYLGLNGSNILPGGGLIGYNLFNTGCLDIVGTSTSNLTNPYNTVEIHDELIVPSVYANNIYINSSNVSSIILNLQNTITTLQNTITTLQSQVVYNSYLIHYGDVTIAPQTIYYMREGNNFTPNFLSGDFFGGIDASGSNISFEYGRLLIRGVVDYDSGRQNAFSNETIPLSLKKDAPYSTVTQNLGESIVGDLGPLYILYSDGNLNPIFEAKSYGQAGGCVSTTTRWFSMNNVSACNGTGLNYAQNGFGIFNEDSSRSFRMMACYLQMR
jgi:hypothetical protein